MCWLVFNMMFYFGGVVFLFSTTLVIAGAGRGMYVCMYVCWGSEN